MTLVVIASQYLQLRAIRYNPLLIPDMHTRILEQITIVWLRLRPPTNSKVKLWCQDMSRPNFLSPAVFPLEFAQTFPVQTHSSNKWCNENVVFFHKLLLGKASPVPWCMWSKNSVGISLDLGIALHLSLGEIRSQRTAGLVPLQSNTRVKSQMIKGHSTHAIIDL